MSKANRIQSHHIDPRVYIGLQSFTVQSYVEANVKRGLQYFIDEELTLTQLQNLQWIFKTNVKPLIVKYYAITADGNFRFRLLEDIVVGTLGTPAQNLIRNYNRIAPIPTTTQLYTGSSFTNGYRIANTRVHPATNQMSMGNNSLSNEGIEIILKPNTFHGLQFENLITNTSNLVTFWMTWYEGETSDDIA